MSQHRYVLALDQGTTSSRAIVFDRSGDAVSVAQQEFQQIYPKPGWVEHDPFAIWSSQNATAIEAISKANLSSDAIAAVGVTNQRETTVVWDAETGQPVYNAIVWQDRRTADFCSQLKMTGVEPSVTARTGLRLDPYFSGTKVRWILDNVAGARARADAGKLRFGTIDSWLLWQLTSGRVHVTDVSNASRTLLLNIHTGEWDDTMLKLLNVPHSMLPQVHSSSEVYGEVSHGLYPAGAPVAGIAGDQQAALFGQACFAPGMAKNTYGTGCFLLMNTGTDAVPSRNNLLTTIAWRIGNKTEYALEGSVFIGGAAVQWLRDELQLVRSAQEVDQLAGSVPDAGGLFIVPAFAGLGAPHWDPYARGVAVGITRGTNRAHFCRAVIEAIALQSADLISCMEKDSGIALQELRVDGGASRSQPLMQFQADLLGTPVVRPKNIETTAMGAAYLAGLAVGFWKSRDDIARNWAADTTFKPSRPPAEMKALRKQWDRALERTMGWEMSG
jgi:glycerol kinase